MTQEHRFRCEIRHLLTLASQSKSDAYLKAVAEKRGQAEADRLRMAARAQWMAGNRGKPNDWR